MQVALASSIEREPVRGRAELAAKYQVFVSSTYGDLKDERDRVIQGILELGHIPVGMEMFSAADEEQWQIIARHIEESDYYVVIVAHRYGSLVGDISYTRKEYEYALTKGVPVIGFVIDPEAAWPGDRIDTDPLDIQRLREFKELVATKPVGFWRGADDLYGQASVALVKAMAANPRTGWIRATSGVRPEVTAEISRLSSENATLRRRIEELSTTSENQHSAELDALWRRLDATKWEHAVKRNGESDWVAAEPIPKSHLFTILAASMVVEASVEVITRLLLTNTHAIGFEDERPRMLPANERNALLAEFMALDLMEPSTRRHPVADKTEYWTLTDRGRELLKSRKRASFEAEWAQSQADRSAGDETSIESPEGGEAEPSPSLDIAT